jgi:patatin-related protein
MAGERTSVSPATQEVRFATAMTGGVSLAIWMGGVARELNLLDHASRGRESGGPLPDARGHDPDAAVCGLYAKLLDALDLVVRIDVLSGTSAGGINAAVLGMCHATGWDLGWLRDVWLRAGDLERLLRDPASKNPPSLLQGDGVLLEQLDRSLRRGRGDMSAARATLVHITTTLLDGETSRFTDSYGTLIPDVDHLGLFRFTDEQLREEGGRGALALAARSSASFPAAFEPAFLAFDKPDTGVRAGPTLRPAMHPYLSMTRPHWAADGGILANRPIQPILDAIFQQPAQDREVRRVQLYVVPDPGGTPARPPADPVDEAAIGQPLSLAASLLHDLNAALSQSIAAELAAIRDHNERVDAMRDSRVRLAEIGAEPTDGAWEDYKARQGRWMVLPVVQALMQRLSTIPAADIPPAWQAALDFGQTIEVACCQAAIDAVTREWARPRPDSDTVQHATLGRLAYDGVKGIIISLMRLAYAVDTSIDTRRALAPLGERVHACFEPVASESLDTLVRTRVDAARAQGTPPKLPDLTAALARAYTLSQAAGAPGPPATEAGQPLAYGLAGAWQCLDEVMKLLVPTLRTIAGRPEAQTDDPTAPVTKLRTYLGYLGDDPGRWRAQLVGLHVTERSMLPVSADVDQKVELIQVSATTRSLLDPDRATPASKLTGTQFHHFGAFYKSSWRANDWMWGRLDGAGWLVHALLDPRRILAVVEAEQVPQGKRAERFAEVLAGCCGGDQQSLLAYVEGELDYLDDDDPHLQPSLPKTALWMAVAWQRHIVAAELPVVAREALANPSRHDQSWAVKVLELAGRPAEAEVASRLAAAQVARGRAARRLRRTQPEAEPKPASAPALDPASRSAIVALLPECPVPDERLRGRADR